MMRCGLVLKVVLVMEMEMMELLLTLRFLFILEKSFNVLDKNKLSCAILSADYDDGYIAYLNGTEISRSYNLPEPGTFVPFDRDYIL